MSNEAAERLREWLARRGFDNGMFADGMAFPLELDAALAAERRATVARIDGAIRRAQADNGFEWGRVVLLWTGQLQALLDAEAER